MYERGQYEEVRRVLDETPDRRDLDRVDSDLRRQGKQWIEAGDVGKRIRRAFVAGAFALEVEHALRSQATRLGVGHAYLLEALPALIPIIAQIGSSASDGELKRDWELACLATLEEWDPPGESDNWLNQDPGWAVLLGRVGRIPIQITQRSFEKEGYLGDVLERFPNEPRFLLARAEAHEGYYTRCIAEFCYDEVTPYALKDLHSRASSAPPDARGWRYTLLGYFHQLAIANLAAFDRLLPVASEFAKLANDHPSVRFEAEVHAGYSAIRAARPDVALKPLGSAANSEDPYVRYLAEFFIGRALTALGRRDEAIAAYRRALQIVPNAPSAAALLAVQLFGRGASVDRLEAHEILERSNAASPRSEDPWDLYWHGDARLWPVYMRRLQQDLRQ